MLRSFASLPISGRFYESSDFLAVALCHRWMDKRTRLPRIQIALTRFGRILQGLIDNAEIRHAFPSLKSKGAFFQLPYRAEPSPDTQSMHLGDQLLEPIRAFQLKQVMPIHGFQFALHRIIAPLTEKLPPIGDYLFLW